ncbi:MAG: dihydrofolate reductase family protein [Gammaproteobacteria bacterium]
MPRIIYSVNITINGCCDHRHVVADEEHHRYATQLIQSADALLLGRNTFDLFEAYWPGAFGNTELPEAVRDLASLLNSVRKYVATNKPLNTTWNNCAPIRGSMDQAIPELRKTTNGTVVMFGSPSLAANLAKIDEIDEFHFLIQPVAIDDNPRLLTGLTVKKDLRLLDSRAFKSGVLLTKYGR